MRLVKFDSIEVHRRIRFVGVTVFNDFLDELDNLRDILAHACQNVRRKNVQAGHVRVILGLEVTSEIEKHLVVQRIIGVGVDGIQVGREDIAAIAEEFLARK